LAAIDAIPVKPIGTNRGKADCGGSCRASPITVPILRDCFRAVNLADFPRKRDSFCEDITVRESLH
jgi:hypothetical protein